VKRLSLFFLTTLFLLPLHASLDGSITEDRIPSIRVDTSNEFSDTYYVAPVMEYIAVGFGLSSYRYLYNGMNFGLDFQWIESKKIKATAGAHCYGFGNRNFTDIVLGTALKSSLTVGDDRAGFIADIRSNMLFPATASGTKSAEIYMGGFFKPDKNITIALTPGFGRYFGAEKNFFMNVILSMEAYLWK